MLPLGSADLPTDAATLAESIRRGFAELFELGKSNLLVDAGTSQWPAVDAIAIDLTGAQAKSDRPVAPDMDDVHDAFEISARTIRLTGKPIKFDAASLTLDLATEAARIRIWRDGPGRDGSGRDGSGRGFWAVSAAGTGRVHLDFLIRDLEALLMSRGKSAAEAHGVTLKKIELQLKPIDDRSLTADAKITAAKSIFAAVLHLGGTLSIDDHLNARLDHLTCRGEGMIGSAAAAMLRPKLEAVFGKPIPLATALGPGIRLNKVKLTVTDRVAVDAGWE